MTTSSKRERGRVIALSALVLCCVGFVGGMFHLQGQAATPTVVRIRQAPKPELVVETEARKKEKILELRDKWQVWAKAHQSELRAMMAAQPDDMKALAAVTGVLPATPQKKTCGITEEDLSGLENYADPVVMQVSWSHMGLDAVPARPELAKELEEGNRRIRSYDRITFGLLREVMVASTSSAWSKKNYCLYASGRVVECKYVIPGIDTSYVDVEPSYQFLVSSK